MKKLQTCWDLWRVKTRRKIKICYIKEERRNTKIVLIELQMVGVIPKTMNSRDTITSRN